MPPDKLPPTDDSPAAAPRHKWHSHWPDTAPSKRERALLQLIARCGGLRVTFKRGESQFSCGDGPVQAGWYRPFGNRDFAKALELHWLEPDPTAPGLFADSPAQRYLVAQRYLAVPR